MRHLQANIENSIIWRKQDQDTYGSVGSKSFSCYLCNYTVFIKDHLIDHMIVHDNNKYVDHTKRNVCKPNAPMSSKTDKLWKCGHCDATFTSKVSLDDHKIRTHPDFISSITSKIHECTICTFKTALKSAIDKHLLKHPEVASDFKFITCIHCNATFKEKRYLYKHVFRKHPDFRTSVTRKLHECPKCSFKTVIKTDFNKHWLKHFKVASDFKLYTCIHCNATFKGKLSLDDHVVRKHPDFMSSVTSKLHNCTKCTFKTVKKLLLDNHVFRKHPDIAAPVTCKLYECTKCTFKTTVKGCFDRHLLNHPEIASNFKLSTCIHCNATFKLKMSLDHHVVRKHPEFISSVTSKLHKCTKCTFKTVKKLLLDNHVFRKHPDIAAPVTCKLYECTKCTFKTTVKGCFDRHLLNHPEVASDFKLSTCIHCNATFKLKMSLDHHVVRKHPEFISSVTSKLHKCTKCTFKTVKKLLLYNHLFRKHPDIAAPVTCKLHKCTKCTFKTTVKGHFDRHLLNHPEIASDFKLSTCIQCNATFKGKLSLDEHVVRKHPEFVTSITSKLHECTRCTFKTVKKHYFDRHLLKHPETASDFKLSTCIHCNATFKEKRYLDEHVVKKHPGFVISITRKLFKCTKCTFQTVRKNVFDNHLLKHPEVASDFKLPTCNHCNVTLASKAKLDNHVVRKHPEFIATVASKIHECPKCTYKTTLRHALQRHMSAHPENVSGKTHNTCSHCSATFRSKTTLQRHMSDHLKKECKKLCRCVHCNATFTRKPMLDAHIIRKHPDFISSVSSKLYECTKCTFKTDEKRSLNNNNNNNNNNIELYLSWRGV
ncbi:unnamed protein product [Callosobruchus maculatus]|uniref:C2H2-type domain-containing protein n=1 Tax=Callosobruchus maculatus TaxID=64391 RepID=A0A653C0M7_CALMS|nr:unnamed protein product [Callosobruchus maculatus]